MGLLAAAFIVLGLVAITARFAARDAGGSIALPRIVDDSIGMWVLRRITGRPLGRVDDRFDAADPLARYRRPSTVLAPRVDPRISLRRPSGLGVAAAMMPGPAFALAPPIEPAWRVVTRSAAPSPAARASALPVVRGATWRARIRPRLAPAWLAGAFVVGFLSGSVLGLITR